MVLHICTASSAIHVAQVSPSVRRKKVWKYAGWVISLQLIIGVVLSLRYYNTPRAENPPPRVELAVFLRSLKDRTSHLKNLVASCLSKNIVLVVLNNPQTSFWIVRILTTSCPSFKALKSLSSSFMNKKALIQTGLSQFICPTCGLFTGLVLICPQINPLTAIKQEVRLLNMKHHDFKLKLLFYLTLSVICHFECLWAERKIRHWSRESQDH